MTSKSYVVFEPFKRYDQDRRPMEDFRIFDTTATCVTLLTLPIGIKWFSSKMICE